MQDFFHQQYELGISRSTYVFISLHDFHPFPKMPGVMGKTGKKKAEKKGSFFDVAWNKKTGLVERQSSRKNPEHSGVRSFKIQIIVNPLK